MPDESTELITRWTLQLSPAGRQAAADASTVDAASAANDAALYIDWQDRIAAADYQKLYADVGAAWNWVDRLQLASDELQRLLDQPERDVGLLCEAAGQLAGFCEIHRPAVDDAEICYFGLLPQCTGRGLGKAFFLRLLQHVLGTASENGRVWLTTCEFDSRAALPFYRRMGFEVIQEERYRQRRSTM